MDIWLKKSKVNVHTLTLNPSPQKAGEGSVEPEMNCHFGRG
jgi:hypothetical protein